MYARMTSKGQVTIPREIRKKLKLQKGSLDRLCPQGTAGRIDPSRRRCHGAQGQCPGAMVPKISTRSRPRSKRESPKMSVAKPRFIDTNIFLRFLTSDLPAQAERCAVLVQRLRDGEEVVSMSPLAVAEIVWTLERFYKLSKAEVAAKVSPLLKLKGLRGANKAVFLRALSLFAEKNISFTDAYIAVQMERAGVEELYSYDRDFDRVEQVKRIEP